MKVVELLAGKNDDITLGLLVGFAPMDDYCQSHFFVTLRLLWFYFSIIINASEEPND